MAWGTKLHTKLLLFARKDNFSTTRAGDLGWAITRETTRVMMAWGQKIHPWATSWEARSSANQRPGMGALTNEKESWDWQSLCQLPRESRKSDETDFYDTDRQLLPSSAQFHSLCNFSRTETFRTWSFVSDQRIFVLILANLRSSPAWPIPSSERCLGISGDNGPAISWYHPTQDEQIIPLRNLFWV